MDRSDLKRLRRELLPYVTTITAIGSTSTQTIFDSVFDRIEENASLEYEENDEWMQRFFQRMVIEELITDQHPAKMILSVSVKHQELVRIMATALAQGLKMRSLIREGYSPALMSDYVLRYLVEIAVNEVDVDFALMVWGVLEQLVLKFGSAERRLAGVFALVKQEVSESRDPSYATFVLISTLGDRRLDKMILKKIVSDSDTEAWWVV